MGQLQRPLAHTRALRARAALASCRLCAHRCGADRRAGPAGRCGADDRPRVFYEAIEWAGERSLVPTYVVSLSGCNMTCAFCITGGPSQDPFAGGPLDADAIGARIERAAARAPLRSVTILGGEPTIHLSGALEIAARVPPGLRLVFKTNAFASGEGRRLLRGVPDVVLADLKFGSDRCAERLAGVSRYQAAVRPNLRWAARESRLIVRHLLMPGHLECCFVPVLDWLARELPAVPLSLMTGYLPVHKAKEIPEICRMNARGEVARAWDLVRARGVHTEPWRLAPSGGAPGSSAPDEIWIDRSGRICVDSASAELVALLQGLAPELRLAN